MMATICVYRHVRLDNNHVFYVGIGSERRAYSKNYRNQHWQNITQISDYRVDILFTNLTKEQAVEKEIEFIALYGRKDCGSGTLCNYTNGGEGISGFSHTTTTRSNLSNIKLDYFKKNKHVRKGKTFINKNSVKVTIVRLCDFKIYRVDSFVLASKLINRSSGSIRNASLKSDRSINGYYVIQGDLTDLTIAWLKANVDTLVDISVRNHNRKLSEQHRTKLSMNLKNMWKKRKILSDNSKSDMT